MSMKLPKNDAAFLSARWREGVLGSERAALAARVVARCVSDDPRDVAVGLAAAAYGTASARALTMLDGLRRG